VWTPCGLIPRGSWVLLFLCCASSLFQAGERRERRRLSWETAGAALGAEARPETDGENVGAEEGNREEGEEEEEEEEGEEEEGSEEVERDSGVESEGEGKRCMPTQGRR